MKRISDNPAVQAHYEFCLSEGTCPALAEMFALGTPPMSNTDREFLEGHANGRQFEDTPQLGDAYAAVAREHGQDPKGKVYLSGLARFPGDPQAWVGGRGDVQDVLDKRGWGAEGSVQRKVQAVAEPLERGLDETIVADKVAEIVGDLGADARGVDTEDLAEQVRDKMTPHWAKAK